MTEGRWLVAFTAAWMLLAAAIALAVHRGLFDSDWREYASIAGAVIAAGVVPLGWLGLTGRYEELAKGWIGERLKSATVTGCVLGVLVAFAIVVGGWALLLKPVKLLCQPKDALISIDDGRPLPCDEVRYVRSDARVTSGLAEGHDTVAAPLASFRVSDGVYRVALPKSAAWRCALRDRRAFPVASEACGAGEWKSSTDFWIRLSADGDFPIAGSVLEVQSRDQKSDVVLQTTDDNCAVAQGPGNKELFDSTLELSSECLVGRRSIDVVITSCDPDASPQTDDRGVRERFRLLMKAHNKGAEDAVEIDCG